MPAEALGPLARRAAASFRLGMEGAAGETLAHLVDALLERLAADPQLAGPVGALLPDLLGAQARRDAIGAADLLEHQLAPLLE